MSNSHKMDTSEVFTMFETINSKLDKQPSKQIEATQIDLSTVNTLSGRSRIVKQQRNYINKKKVSEMRDKRVFTDKNSKQNCTFALY